MRANIKRISTPELLARIRQEMRSVNMWRDRLEGIFSGEPEFVACLVDNNWSMVYFYTTEPMNNNCKKRLKNEAYEANSQSVGIITIQTTSLDALLGDEPGGEL